MMCTRGPQEGGWGGEGGAKQAHVCGLFHQPATTVLILSASPCGSLQAPPCCSSSARCSPRSRARGRPEVHSQPCRMQSGAFCHLESCTGMSSSGKEGLRWRQQTQKFRVRGDAERGGAAPAWTRPAASCCCEGERALLLRVRSHKCNAED